MTYTPVVGSLAYVFDRELDEVLLIHRDRRADDEHYGKVNGLGGKLEDGESITTNVRRELFEEARIVITSMSLRGTISWPGFGSTGEDWLGFIFLVDGWTGTPPGSNDEGTLRWVPRQRLLAACSEDDGVRSEADLPLWEGDRWFVPLVFDDDPRSFHGLMPYSNGEAIRWEAERL